MQIASFSPADTSRLNGAYEKHRSKTLPVEILNTTPFDLADIYPEGDSRILFDFAELIGERIKSTFPFSKHPGLKEMIRRFVSTDDDTNGYLTGLGELAILSELLQMPFANVNAVEPPLPNGKKADFQVTISGNNQFIEVLTVRFDATQIERDQDVVDFFVGRAKQKLDAKAQNLAADFPLLLFLVIFAADDITKLASFPKGLWHLCDSLEKMCTFSPFVIAPFSQPGSSWKYDIHPVTHLISTTDDA